MWTDYQGISLADAKANIALIQEAKLTGLPTMIQLAGNRVEYNPSVGSDKFDASLIIAELQEYCWQISYNGWDWQADINPRAWRAGVTLQRFG